jgi:hypothetical protein
MLLSCWLSISSKHLCFICSLALHQDPIFGRRLIFVHCQSIEAEMNLIDSWEICVMLKGVFLQFLLTSSTLALMELPSSYPMIKSCWILSILTKGCILSDLWTFAQIWVTVQRFKGWDLGSVLCILSSNMIFS